LRSTDLPPQKTINKEIFEETKLLIDRMFNFYNYLFRNSLN